MIHLFGISIYECDVAVTDFLLFIESVIFSTIFYRHFSNEMLGRLLAAFFLSLGLSSLLGACFHAFFPDKTATGGGLILWMMVSFNIGIAASVLWGINAVVAKGTSFLKATAPFVLLNMAVFLYVIMFVNHQFKTIIAFYLPPLMMLAFIACIKFLKKEGLSWVYLFAGIMLSFIAAAVQYFKIDLHPKFFNFNALYHLIQGASLLIIFVSFRSVLRKS
jgi:hypothetical protein